MTCSAAAPRPHPNATPRRVAPAAHTHARARARVNAGLSALAYLACCLWSLGYPEQALKRSQEALTLARELSHPFSLADVLMYAGCLLCQMRRDAQALKEHTKELIRLAAARVPGWSGEGTSFRGAALAMLGQVEQGIAQMRQGIADTEAIGLRCYRTATLFSLAEAQAETGRLGEALATLSEALALVEETEERHWEAELHRLRGELLLMNDEGVEAEASLHQALEVARRQNAKSWELRAAMSLSRLWSRRGQCEDARHLLDGVYRWFTEGFDTPDLREARALLDELSS